MIKDVKVASKVSKKRLKYFQTMCRNSKDGYDKYLNSPEWKKTKKAFLEIWDALYGHECFFRCGSGTVLNVHHRDWTYGQLTGRCPLGQEMFSDLVLLCRKCHNLFHQRIRLEKAQRGQINDNCEIGDTRADLLSMLEELAVVDPAVKKEIKKKYVPDIDSLIKRTQKPINKRRNKTKINLKEECKDFLDGL